MSYNFQYNSNFEGSGYHFSYNDIISVKVYTRDIDTKYKEIVLNIHINVNEYQIFEWRQYSL